MAVENITILDIAEEAGVSPATVSRVISGYPNVSAATYDKVKAVIDKYNFKPNSIARGLLQKHTYTLGVILPHVAQPHYASVFSAAQQEAARNGYVVQPYRLAYHSQLTEAFIDQLIERRLDGVLLAGAFADATRPMELVRLLKRLRQYMPIVMMEPPVAEVECISIYTDMEEGIRKAVRHLYALGHKRIAFVGAMPQARGAGERERGFHDEMEKLGLTPMVQTEGTHTAAMGEMATLKLLSGTPKAQWPSGIIAVNDLMALGILKQLFSMGLRLPEDMAVIGCDNQFFAGYTQPALTTVDVDAVGHGSMAMRQLLDAMEEEGTAFTQVREPTLVVRESCGAQLGRRTVSP